jgi:octaprenyl-diphosphate synthase
MDTKGMILDKYKEEITRINEELEIALHSRVSLLEEIGNHILLGHGKRLRPLFFVLSCELCNYRGKDRYRLSSIFEYLHAASLLHDDVLDNAEIRRKKPSANRFWGNQAAVLEGDYLYSAASEIAVDSNNLRFLKRLSGTSKQMAEGQVLELIHTNDWATTKEAYLEIITAKTAVLISAACACGAIISGAGSAAEVSLGDFGLSAGIAFQLMDDLLDYTSSEEVFGKPVGKDLKEGKITLPLIYTLPRIDAPERKRLGRLFRDRQAKDEDYQRVMRLVREGGALDQIRDEAHSYVEMASGYLNTFPDSPIKENLLELNQYIIDREF